MTDYSPMKRGGMLITGCPRSGTRAVAEFFKDRGCELGHETAGEKGTVDWRLAYKVMDEDDPEFIIQMTLVRDPVKTVQSLSSLLLNTNRKSDTWGYIKELSVHGGWDCEMADVADIETPITQIDWIPVAAKWWTTVYRHLYQFPVLVLEHIPNVKNVGENSDVIRNLNVALLLSDNEEFWEIARAYGYYHD